MKFDPILMHVIETTARLNDGHSLPFDWFLNLQKWQFHRERILSKKHDQYVMLSRLLKSNE